MPLVEGSGREAISENIATERKAGKPEDPAAAIAYSKARGDAEYGGKLASYYPEGKPSPGKKINYNPEDVARWKRKEEAKKGKKDDLLGPDIATPANSLFHAMLAFRDFTAKLDSFGSGKFEGATANEDLKEAGIVRGDSSKADASGMYVIWEALRGRKFPVSSESDSEVDRALKAAEKAAGKKFPRDGRTGYPGFTLYDAKGEEIGGG